MPNEICNLPHTIYISLTVGHHPVAGGRRNRKGRREEGTGRSRGGRRKEEGNRMKTELSIVTKS